MPDCTNVIFSANPDIPNIPKQIDRQQQRNMPIRIDLNMLFGSVRHNANAMREEGNVMDKLFKAKK